MRTLIYLDESGDLGFSMDKPYQQGGSSRMLSLAAVSLPETKSKYIQRIVRAIYQKRKRPLRHELKSVDLNTADKALFLQLTEKLLKEHSDIQLHSITVFKDNVKPRFRQDPNVLYNYMVKLLLLETICQYEYVDFIPDRRSERVNSKWNMGEYLNQMIQEASLEHSVINKSCVISPMDSAKHLELQFIDFYTGLVWSKYEFGDKRMIEFTSQFKDSNRLTNRQLFFNEIFCK
ncbi:DUF3800 domain-containing protein [Moraxella marmotae]|uniref:DUF3800 domain-containing protein n=1 Tax=Moraxella marmotae TaxID=3344520 RepID=UPI0035F34206